MRNAAHRILFAQSEYFFACRSNADKR